MRIRPMRAEDAEAVAAFARALGELTEGVGEMTAEAVRRDLLDTARGLDCLVAEIDGAVIGYALHHVAYESAWAARGRYLSDLYVAPEARRRGVARALIRAVARAARDEGGVFLWWIEMAGGAEAKALYRTLADVADPITAYAATRGAFAKLLTD